MRRLRSLTSALSFCALAMACSAATVVPLALTGTASPAAPGSARLMVFVSDLHLGVGRLANRDWHPYEDFRWEREFTRFLERVNHEGGGRTDLVLNGDTFELWQTIDEPCVHSSADFGCTESQVLRRLDRVLREHRPELHALAAFAASGSNTVTIVPGNHDAALLFPAVRRAVLAAVSAPAGRVTIPVSGFWLSPDGLIYAEHGHQIGAEVNRFDGWPQPFVQHTGGLSLRRPWGERFVQSYYNRFETKYPIIDNIADERAAAWLAMSAEGGFRAAAASAEFIRFFLLGVSWRQLGQSLREEGAPPEWDVELIRKRGGQRFIVDSFPAGDPLRLELERQAREQGLPLDVSALTSTEIRAICDERAGLIEQGKEGVPGLTPCPRENEGLGAIAEKFTRSRDDLFSEHLKKTYIALGQTTQRFALFVYSHTHLVDTGFHPLRAENLGWDPRVVNTGAWQRVVSPATVRAWNLAPADALRRTVESLPACYSLVWVPPYHTAPTAEIRSWREISDGSWDFGPKCEH